MLHVFSIHNEVLQNAYSLHILLDSPTTCINNSAIAKRFQGKALPAPFLVVRMRSANTTLFSLTLSFSLHFSASCIHSHSCTLSFQGTGGIRPLDQPQGCICICIHTHHACVLLGGELYLFPSIPLRGNNLVFL